MTTLFSARSTALRTHDPAALDAEWATWQLAHPHWRDDPAAIDKALYDDTRPQPVYYPNGVLGDSRYRGPLDPEIGLLTPALRLWVPPLVDPNPNQWYGTGGLRLTGKYAGTPLVRLTILVQTWGTEDTSVFPAITDCVSSWADLSLGEHTKEIHEEMVAWGSDQGPSLLTLWVGQVVGWFGLPANLPVSGRGVPWWQWQGEAGGFEWASCHFEFYLQPHDGRLYLPSRNRGYFEEPSVPQGEYAGWVHFEGIPQ